jgi:HPt (histidine-containing phosphotransfer) domain-containing protein
MLIYNSAKEFIGIDEHDLKALGFSNLLQLRSESADFADLFVRTPGYVHNFQHVHWIDFVACAESIEESKVIISAKSKSYTAYLSITKAYLRENPTSEAYFVSLNNLRALSSKESDSIASEITNKLAPVAAIDEAQNKEMIPDEPIIKDAFDEEDEVLQNIQPLTFAEESYEISDAPLDLDLDFEDEEIAHEPVEFPEPAPTIARSVTPLSTPEPVDDGDDYLFDPKVASEELGLPVDLIEEFIQDFIAQAKEFKAEMYSSLEGHDIDRLAILSHKLKGVAANLRIENALSAITTVNISKDVDVIKTNLDLFYRIMSKLAGEEISVQEEVAVEEIQTPDDEDDFVLDFKDDVEEEVVIEQTQSDNEIKDVEDDDFVLDFKEETSMKNVDVPDKIELPALVDDDYLTTDIKIEEESAELRQEKPVESTQAVSISYSKEVSAKAIGLDMETFEELFGDYIQDSRDISSRIHQALAANSLEKCAKEARILKGMSDSMQVKEFTSELESLISSSDKNEMMHAIEKIENIIEEISKLRIK